MKHNPIDNLFRKRLEQHDSAPVPGGWDKLEAMLDAKEKPAKKRKAIYWYAVAAAVVILVMVLTPILLDSDKPDGQMVANNTEENDPVNLNEQEAIAEVEAPVKHEEISEPVTESKTALAVHKGEAQEEIITPPVVKEPVIKQQPAEKVIVAQTEPIAPVVNNQPETAIAQAVPSGKESLPELDIKEAEKSDIQIALPEIKEVELEKAVALKEEPAKHPVTIAYIDGPSDEKASKKLTVKKIFNFAKDVKEGEVGLADIREAKENLLTGRFGRSSD